MENIVDNFLNVLLKANVISGVKRSGSGGKVAEGEGSAVFAARKLYNWAIEANEAGDPFPVSLLPVLKLSQNCRDCLTIQAHHFRKRGLAGLQPMQVCCNIRPFDAVFLHAD